MLSGVSFRSLRKPQKGITVLDPNPPGQGSLHAPRRQGPCRDGQWAPGGSCPQPACLQLPALPRGAAEIVWEAAAKKRLISKSTKEVCQITKIGGLDCYDPCF